ncbi:hypothetical protein GCM10007857_77910 [Bradyrhizobium iriomotense]|uniref:Secreted protein n=1 Tax=Bradyrhizobium iriomotense TaxID=441950 RepID=A0ABQ6BDT5_9BRAD|nr:hypothetical protein GCM10007857_77910 [Bradyrhizobium iriomotense]
MLGLVILFSTAAVSFGAGYATRAALSRERRAEYLKYEPYLRPTRTSEPPAFLLRPSTDTRARSPRTSNPAAS